MSTARCSAASLDVEEPLAGTAVDSVDRWLLLEVTDPWEPKALQTEALPTTVRERLALWSEAPRTRLQLVRRPGRPRNRPLLAVVSSSGSISRLELDRYDDILDVQLDTLPSTEASPMVLVCAHGKRDRCCALHGSAVYRALAGHDGLEVWQTSHLGGHRFAACALSLPDGLMFGRLRREHAAAFARSVHDREIFDLDLLRGRCEYDRPTQAAEIFVRRRNGNRDIEALELNHRRQDADTQWTASFRTPAGEQSVTVRLEELGAHRPASCGGEPEPVTRFVEA